MTQALVIACFRCALREQAILELLPQRPDPPAGRLLARLPALARTFVAVLGVFTSLFCAVHFAEILAARPPQCCSYDAVTNAITDTAAPLDSQVPACVTLLRFELSAALVAVIAPFLTGSTKQLTFDFNWLAPAAVDAAADLVETVLPSFCHMAGHQLPGPRTFLVDNRYNPWLLHVNINRPAALTERWPQRRTCPGKLDARNDVCSVFSVWKSSASPPLASCQACRTSTRGLYKAALSAKTRSCAAARGRLCRYRAHIVSLPAAAHNLALNFPSPSVLQPQKALRFTLELAAPSCATVACDFKDPIGSPAGFALAKQFAVARLYLPAADLRPSEKIAVAYPVICNLQLRKHTAIALDLVGFSVIMFLDEPTSGFELLSTLASNKTLRRHTIDAGLIVGIIY
ncbi:hypothetical protein HK405_006870 [Cladochytrium tenue]|nr:hypothetical protein HK405_006870 [Cladochytrium tenue]